MIHSFIIIKNNINIYKYNIEYRYVADDNGAHDPHTGNMWAGTTYSLFE